MPRGAELTPQLRSRICELRSLGFSYGKIAKLHPEVNKSTIATTCHREALRDDNKTLPRSGRPRKVSEEQREKVKEMIKANPKVRNEELLEAIGHCIKARALRMLRKELKVSRIS